MDPIYEIELQDCPYCRGTGTVEDELLRPRIARHVVVDRLRAAQQVAHLWNVGKVLNPGVGD